jgi:hypothetical protein
VADDVGDGFLLFSVKSTFASRKKKEKKVFASLRRSVSLATRVARRKVK